MSIMLTSRQKNQAQQVRDDLVEVDLQQIWFDYTYGGKRVSFESYVLQMAKGQND